MSTPFTIRIFVSDGDPEGIRIIDRMNWTGTGIVFPRAKWEDVKQRNEMNKTGIYILVGYQENDSDLPRIYIGQADGIRNRMESHFKNKEFWDWAVCFVSNSSGLNRAHVTWLEYELIQRAKRIRRCHLDNSNEPQEPSLSEAEKADIQGFLNEILQILPLVGLRVFEPVKTIKVCSYTKPDDVTKNKPPHWYKGEDTIIVPAQREGFEGCFLGEKCWYAIRISSGMLERIKYIAAYQTAPISAITHYAEVDLIEPYGDSGKYKLIFRGEPKEIKQIPYADAPKGSMQGIRYTHFDKLQTANKVSELSLSG
jgi:hypothetical protein